MSRPSVLSCLVAFACCVAPVHAADVPALPVGCRPDPVLVAEAEKRFPANQWVEITPRSIIPEAWQGGRQVYVNSYSSLAYCGSLGVVMTMDGYTTVPAGKIIPNNYSDSVYTFDPITGALELFKRSNWHAGARSKDPAGTSYPYDENRSDPTPCPRHLYKGITWSPDDDAFYLINGANAGVPNEHPKFALNNGTATYTFWAMDVGRRTWKQLPYPKLKRTDQYETVLTAIPGTGKLFYFDAWNVASYDLKAGTWSVLKGDDGRPVGFNSYAAGGVAMVDSRRRRVVFYWGSSWHTKVPLLTRDQFYVYDVATNEHAVLTSTNQLDATPIVAGTYVTHLDTYLLLCDQGLRTFDPTALAWKALPVALPAWMSKPGSWTYFTYDAKRQLVICNSRNNWAVLRLDGKLP